jgi:hypothetical protein
VAAALCVISGTGTGKLDRLGGAVEEHRRSHENRRARSVVRSCPCEPCAARALKISGKVWLTEKGRDGSGEVGIGDEAGACHRGAGGGLGLGGSELAAALGASARTIERGRTGRTTRSTLRGSAWPSSSPWRRISKKLGDPDARRAWLRSGNPYLGG